MAYLWVILLCSFSCFVLGAIGGHEAALRYIRDSGRGQVLLQMPGLYDEQDIVNAFECAGKSGGTVKIGAGEWSIPQTICSASPQKETP